MEEEGWRRYGGGRLGVEGVNEEGGMREGVGV